MNRKLPLLVAALIAASVTSRAQVLPEFDVPWIGYDVNVYPNISAWPTGTGDFDGDGNLDLAVANTVNPELSILLGDGNGGFAPPATYPLLLGPMGLAVVDLDGDLDLDVVVTDTGKFWEGVSFSVYDNLGDGTFVYGGSHLAGAGPNGITVDDFDGDGLPDVAVAHDAYITCANTVAVMYQLPGGDFTLPQTYTLLGCTNEITSGDLDGDGLPDLVVGHEGSRVSVLRNLGTTFASPVAYAGIPTGFFGVIAVVHLADVDQDADLDVLYSTPDTGNGTGGIGYGAVALFRNDGTGALLPPETVPLIPGDNGASWLTTSDLTGDGWLDLVATTGTSGSWALVPGDGAGGFGASQMFRATGQPQGVETPDLDGDGDPDVVVVGALTTEAAVYLNPGDGTFVQPAWNEMTDKTKAPTSYSQMEVADLDNDGDQDLVVGYSHNFLSQYGIHVIRSNGDGTFAAPEDYPLPAFPEEIEVADLDRDGWKDVLYLSGNFNPRLRYRLNQGDGTFGDGTILGPVFCSTYNADIEVRDVEGDGDMDVLLANCLTGFYTILNDGSMNFPETKVHALSSFATILGAADFDGDGDVDVATNSAVQGYLEVSLGNGDGTYQAPFLQQTGRAADSVLVEDLDGNGILDIAAGYGLDESGVSVILGRGDGSFRPPTNYHGSYGDGVANNVHAVDVDRDGDLDLLAAHYESQDVSLWRNQGDGTFARHLRYGVGGPAWNLSLADFTGDGIADLLTQVEPDDGAGGWYYPAFTVLEGLDDRWVDLGNAKLGSRGLPRLEGAGLLQGGTVATVTVSEALENAPGVHILGISQVNLPLLGGVLVPNPNVLVPFATDGAGVASLSLPWPAGLPPGTQLFFQSWIVDPAATAGLSATNGIVATQP